MPVPDANALAPLPTLVQSLDDVVREGTLFHILQIGLDVLGRRRADDDGIAFWPAELAVMLHPAQGALGLGQAVLLCHGPQQIQSIEVFLAPVAAPVHFALPLVWVEARAAFNVFVGVLAPVAVGQVAAGQRVVVVKGDVVVAQAG